MEIILAGYNIDTEVLNEMMVKTVERQDATPETLAAAYARISRSPKPVNELRRNAREEVEKARKSNKIARWLLKNTGRHVCPFCKAYEKEHGKPAYK